MSEPHPGDHGIQHAPAAHGAATQPYFSYEEWLQFQRSDMGAGGVVVALMAGIFTIGLILYSIIAIAVAT